MAPKLKKKKQSSASVIEKQAQRVWTDEENETLISRMISNLPSPDTTKFSLTLERVKWNDLAFNNFSAEDCRSRWDTIVKEIRKYRTLSEILEDAKEYIKDPYKGQYKKHPDYPKRPLTPYFRYFVEHRDQYARKHTDMNNLEVTAELSKMYRNLSQAKKDSYITEWKKETAVYRVAMEKFKNAHPDYFKMMQKSPKEPRQPATIYRDGQLQQFAAAHPKLSPKACTETLKANFKKLKDEEKVVYVNMALKEEELYLQAMEKYEEAHPDGPKKKKRNRTVLSKQELKLTDKLQGKPPKPPSNGYNLFCTEMMAQLTNLTSQQRIVECGKLWNLKPAEEKAQFHNRYVEMKKTYEEQYKVFFDNLSPEQQQRETQLLLDAKSKSSKRRNPVPSAETPKRPKLQEKASSSSEEDDDDSSDDDDSDDVDRDESSDSSDDEESEDEDESDNEEKENEKKDEEDEKYRKLVPARPTTPISALFLYQKAHRKKVESQYPQMSSDEITRLLARRYHELPEHKRHKYVQKEKAQRALYNEKMQQHIKEGLKKNGVEEDKLPQPQAITGEQIFHDKHYSQYLKKHQDKEETEKALQTAWSKMNKTRRDPYITAAQEQNQKSITLYQDACKEAGIPTVPSPAVSTFKKKVKFENEPKKPPRSGYQVFGNTNQSSLTHLSGHERFKEIGRRWKSLPPEHKEYFNNEAKKGNQRYLKDLEAWKKTLSPEVALQYELLHKTKKVKKTAANLKQVETIGEVYETENQTLPQSEDDSSDSEDSDSSSSEEEDSDDASSSDEESDSSSSSSGESSDDGSSSSSDSE